MTIAGEHPYRDGRRVDGRPTGRPADAEPSDSEFVWVELNDPTPEEMRTLQERFDLHHLAVEDAQEVQQLPKLETFGEQLFIVAHTAVLRDDHLAYGQTCIFAGRHHLVTVQQENILEHEGLRKRVERSPELLRQGIGYLLHAILDSIVDSYQPIIDQIEEDVLALEERVLVKTLDRDEVARIFRLRRELARFQREFGPMSDMIGKLINLDLPCIGRDTRPYFRDVLDNARRTDLTVGGLREVIASVFELSTLLEQQKQGDINRRLAAWAAIMAVPTAITGIYGMNFDNMPELHWRFGYFVVIGLIITLCSVLYVRLRRADWL